LQVPGEDSREALSQYVRVALWLGTVAWEFDLRFDLTYLAVRRLFASSHPCADFFEGQALAPELSHSINHSLRHATPPRGGNVTAALRPSFLHRASPRRLW